MMQHSDDDLDDRSILIPKQYQESEKDQPFCLFIGHLNKERVSRRLSPVFSGDFESKDAQQQQKALSRLSANNFSFHLQYFQSS